MPNRQGWISLDSCITDYMGEAELSIHRYKKLFDIAFRGMDDLGLDMFYQVATYALPINSNNTVTIPSNCLKLVKVGILNAQGEVVSLNRNSSLTNYDDLFPNRIAQLQSLAPSLCPLNVSPWAFNNYWYGDTYITLYGLPSGAPFIGQYTVDEYNSVIVLDQYFNCDYLIVECVISPKEGEEYYLPIQFRESLIEWMGWRDIKNMPNTRKGSLGDKRDRKHDYYNARRLAIARYHPFYPEEAHQISVENVRLTVKI